MEKKKGKGRPKGQKKTTLLIGVTFDEAEKIKKAHADFMKKNNVKISKTAFVKSFLGELLK